MNTSPCLGLPFGEIGTRQMTFSLGLLAFPQLCSIKPPGIQTLIWWLFGDISLPSSWSGGMASRTDRKPPRMRAGDERKPHPIRIHSHGQGMGFILRAAGSLKAASASEKHNLFRVVRSVFGSLRRCVRGGLGKARRGAEAASVAQRGPVVACAGGWRKRGEEGRGGVCSGENRSEVGNRTWSTKINAQ